MESINGGINNTGDVVKAGCDKEYASGYCKGVGV